MTNRLFDRSISYFNNLDSRNSMRPFNFALKQQLAFAAEMDEQLRELETRFVRKPCSHLVHQLRGGTAATDKSSETCTYDDFGLVEGLEIDVSWM